MGRPPGGLFFAKWFRMVAKCFELVLRNFRSVDSGIRLAV